METLMVVVEHRNNYYSRGRLSGSGSGRFGSSPSSRGFREINCRAFESGGGGLLPSPLKACSAPFLSNGYLSSSPRTPTVCENASYCSKSGDGRVLKRNNVRSSPIPIDFEGGKKEMVPFSERWAGPAYSNSPPPSSVPLPKFGLKPKRSVSLELPPTESEIVTPHAFAKSAPASPTRGSKYSVVSFLRNDDDATKTLRRILNLDVADD